ncbi:MAG: hypothetical protein IPL46_30360 [Saprospiraceae bacterium]|nr:hypothetical protein [Saprospiraceae bacterium]
MRARYTYITRLVISLLAIASISICFGQPINNSIGDVTLPSANASSLGKFGEIPVSYFTGVAGISVPIYTVTQGPLALPVSIDYHPSGVKVAEVASRVGLNWAESIGGSIMISRTPVGIIDEHPNGWFNQTVTSLNGTLLEYIADGTSDSEPDLFSFNIGGYSGKFVFAINARDTNSIEPMIMPRQDVKITRIIDGSALFGFKVITPDGTVYYFGQHGSTNALERSAPDTETSGVTTGWYLVRVESHDQKHSINLSYATEKYHYPYPASAENYNTTQISNCGVTGSSGVRYLNRYNTDVNYSYIEGMRLTQITNSGGTQTVTFVVSSSDRDDIDSDLSYPAYPLSRIEVRNGSTYGKRFDFSQTYFQSNYNSTDNIGPGTASSPWYKRLKLNSIQEKSLNGSVTINPWTFTYFGTNNALPHRLSRAVDHWGFYNGEISNGPKAVNVPPTRVGNYYYGSSHRDSDETYMRYGTVQKVTYPTLGFTRYKLGANRYYYSIEEATTDTLLKTLTTCSVGFSELCCDYIPPTPLSSGTFDMTSAEGLTAEVDLKIILGDPVFGNCNGGPKELRFALYRSNGTQIGTTLSFNDDIRFKLTDMVGTFGGGTFYFTFQTYNSGGKAEFYVKKAKEIDVGGLRIEGMAHYTKDSTLLDTASYDYSEATSSRSSGKLYVSPVYGDEVADGSYVHTFFRDISVVPLAGFDGYHIGYERVVEIKPGHGSTEHLMLVEPRAGTMSYPQVPDVFVARNGQVDEINTFNQGNTLLKSTTNGYTYSYKWLTTSPFKVFYFKQTAGQITCFYFRVATYPVRTAYNLLINKSEYLDGMQHSTTYQYNTNDQLFPITEIINNSDGAVHRTEFSYAPTYINSTIKTKLEDQNRILPAWKTIKKVDGVNVDGDSTTYSFYSTSTGLPTGSATTLLYPHKNYRYEMSWDAAGSTVGKTWKLQMTIDKYQLNSGVPAQDLGLPAEVTIDGWTDKIKYQWTASGQQKKWTFKDHSKGYAYYTGSDLLLRDTAVDGTVRTYTWDGLMRLKDVTDCKGVKVALAYDYRHLTTATLINRISTTTTYPTLGILTNKSLTNTTFFADLGKPIQTLRPQQDPPSSITSIAQQHVYNTIARPIQKHEPVGATHAPNNYVAAPSDYTLTTYETSPLARPVTVQPPSTGILGRLQYEYGTNTGTEVYDHVHNQNYGAGKLHKTVVIDGNGNQTQTFVDIRGRTVLTRRKDGSSAAKEDTYTLYDDKDRPVIVLPPGTTKDSTKLIFTYLYHVDDLIKEQRTPDHGREQFVYNKRDLLAYRSDSNMVAAGHWYAMVYDPYGRSDKEGFSTATPGAHNSFTEATITTELIDFDYGSSGIEKDKLIFSSAKLLNGSGNIRSFYTYDGCGRLIKETRNSVPQQGVDTSCVILYTYDAADNVLTETIRTPNGLSRLTVLNKNEYDHAGRLIKDKIKVNNYAEQQLSHIEYTVKEQIAKLKLGASSVFPLQTIDFVYRSNQLLDKINDPSTLGNDLFALRLYYDNPVSGSTAPARFNGDITNMAWKTPFDTHQQGYAFFYDYLDRLTKGRYADYTGSGFTNLDRFTTTYTYDERSNFDVITRQGFNNSAGTTYGLIDNMKYAYPSGNKINTIDDLTNSAFGYTENASAYAYDGNGNMTEDPSKACDLVYNHLNKLDSIGVDDGSSLHFMHDALGNLHRKTTIDDQGVSRNRDYFNQVELLNGFVDFIHHANGYVNMLYSVEEELTLTGNEPNNNFNYQALKINSSRNTSGNKTITYTAGEIDLMQSFDVAQGSSVTAQIQNFTPSGLAYSYVIRDHLGNNRVFFTDENSNGSIDTSEVISVHSYYPGGMDFGQKKNTNEEFGYRFGGKEELEFTKYLSFGARCLDVSICRFTSTDRFASKFPGQNPFAYAASSPVLYVDVNGDSINVNNIITNNPTAAKALELGLEDATGLDLVADASGNVTYGTEKGFLGSKKAKIARDADGKKLGSRSARKALISAIKSDGTINILDNTGGGNFVYTGSNDIHFDLTEINMIQGMLSPDVNSSTFGPGLVALHELSHTQIGEEEVMGRNRLNP